MNSEVCHEHSGCVTDITNLKHDNTKQWQEIGKLNARMESMMTRLNIILGSVVVACVMLVINILLKAV